VGIQVVCVFQFVTCSLRSRACHQSGSPPLCKARFLSYVSCWVRVYWTDV